MKLKRWKKKKEESRQHHTETKSKTNVEREKNIKTDQKKSEAHREFDLGKNKSRKKKHVKNIVWIGTSISKALDKQKFEKDTNTRLKLVKSYGISRFRGPLKPIQGEQA